MEWKLAGLVFTSVFLAELGDKTQLATILFAANQQSSKLVIFLAASAALVLAAGLGVLVGGLLGRYANERLLHWMAGLGFILIGCYTLWKS
jgi:putative Ca2+/H+ antiporter (TMEM165/GDT1 family)